MATNIHLIEKSASYRRVPGTDDQWITGRWRMSATTARSLVGGKVYLHTAQSAPCYLGGEVLECTLVEPSKYEIRFRFERETVNVTTDRCDAKWSVEKLLDGGRVRKAS